MRLSLQVTSTPTASLYSLNGPKFLKHRSGTFSLTDEGSNLLALIKGLTVVNKKRAKLIWDCHGSRNLNDYLIPITIKCSNAAFLEAVKALTELEDPSGLPPEVETLHGLLKGFKVFFHKVRPADNNALTTWAERASA